MPIFAISNFLNASAGGESSGPDIDDITLRIAAAETEIDVLQTDLDLKADKADLSDGNQIVSTRTKGFDTTLRNSNVSGALVHDAIQYKQENGNPSITLPTIVAHNTATIATAQIREGALLTLINHATTRNIIFIPSGGQSITVGTTEKTDRVYGSPSTINRLIALKKATGEFTWFQLPILPNTPEKLATISDISSIQGDFDDIAIRVAAVETSKADINHTHSDLIPIVQKAAANGVATLDGTGKIPESQLPPIKVSSVHAVTSEAEMLALADLIVGAVAIRSDERKSYILKEFPASDLANWLELLSPTDAVSSVNSMVGEVVLTAINVGAIAVADIAIYQDILDGTASKVLDAAVFKQWQDQYDFKKLDYVLPQDRTINLMSSENVRKFGYDNRVFNGDFLQQGWVLAGNVVSSVFYDAVIGENVWYNPDDSSGGHSDYTQDLVQAWWEQARTDPNGITVIYDIKVLGGIENLWFGMTADTHTALTAAGLGFPSVTGQCGFRIRAGKSGDLPYIDILDGVGDEAGVQTFAQSATSYNIIRLHIPHGSESAEVYGNGEYLGLAPIKQLNHSYFNDKMNVGSGMSASTDERVYIRGIHITPNLLSFLAVLTVENFEKNQIINTPSDTADYDIMLPDRDVAYGACVEINCFNTGLVNIKDNSGALIRAINSTGDTSIKILQIATDAAGNGVAGKHFTAIVSNKAPSA